MEFILAPETLLLLFFAGLTAGTIDTIAGGGGLITIPALLLAQIPPIFALGTNKLQSSFGSFTATLMMARKGLIDPRKSWKQILGVFIGSALGTLAVQQIDPIYLNFIIPILLIGIAIYFLTAKMPGHVETQGKMNESTYTKTVLPAIGFYDGFLGPGTGSFFCMTNIWLRGMDIIKATAHAKLFNFTSNIASLIVFLIGGKILFLPATAMIAGQILGAYIGSHIVLTHGRRFIRPVIVLVCFAMLMKYLLNYFQLI